LCGSVDLQLWKRIVKVLLFVWNVVSYGEETWTLRKSDIRQLRESEIWIWHRMLGYHGLKTKWMKTWLGAVETRNELLDKLTS